MWTHFSWFRQGAVTGSFEDGKEISLCTEGGEILVQLSICQFIQEDSASPNYKSARAEKPPLLNQKEKGGVRSNYLHFASLGSGTHTRHDLNTGIGHVSRSIIKIVFTQ